MTENLRPIGIEFEIDFGVDSFSTDPRGRKIKYRITDHKLVMGADGKNKMVEAIEAISTEYYEIDWTKINPHFLYLHF